MSEKTAWVILAALVLAYIAASMNSAKAGGVMSVTPGSGYT